MRVVCIDGKHDDPNHYQLEEGKEYQVYQSPVYSHCYKVVGYKYGYTGRGANYRKRRFVPISDIDETELLKQRQENYDKVVCLQHLQS